MDDVAAEWRSRFLATVESLTGRDEPVVLQSGGMDSMTITAALLALDRRPRLVSFTVGGRWYDDLNRVSRIASRFGLSLDVENIPRTDAQVVDDVLKAWSAGARLKTHVQCWQPVHHMGVRVLERFGPSTVWMGTGGICEDARRCVVVWRQQGEEAAREIRRGTLIAGGSDGSATQMMHRALTDLGHTVAEPYAHPSFAPFSLSLDLAEINRPRQKGIALRAFPEFYDRTRLWKQNSSLQVGAGVREWHDQVLLDARYNPDGYKQVVAVYRRIVDALADHHT